MSGNGHSIYLNNATVTLDGSINVTGSIYGYAILNISGGHITAGNITLNEIWHNAELRIRITGGIVETGSISVINRGTTNPRAVFDVNGDTVVFANSITVQADNETSSENYTQGVVFEGSTGTVYGSVTLPDSITIPEGYTLTIPNGASLTVPEEMTIENYGTIIIEEGGQLNGTVNNYHSVSVDDTITGGKVTASASSATKGTTVTLTPSATDGYHFSSWNVTSGGTPITVMNNQFTMPNADVKVSATFDVHQFSYAYNSDGHWEECSGCDATRNPASHSGSDDGNCTTPVTCVCGYEITAAQSAHNYKYASDANNHWQVCQNANCTATTTAVAHNWDENSVCTVCGYGCRHFGGTATCTEQAVCDICGHPYGSLLAHSLELIAKNPATCTENGNIAYYRCSSCGGLFSDSEGTNPISLESTVIPATGHTLTFHPAVDPTYTSDGMKAYSQCAVCGKIFDENGAETTLDALRIPALIPEPEDEEEEPYIPSTPISDGWHHYSSGSMYYQDGKRTRGWADIDGARYYFDEKGFMATGWKEIEPDSGNWYHFGEDGALDFGWYKEGNVWYYLDLETGRMYDNGLTTIGKFTYYFYDWGGMANSWWYEAEDGGWYYFSGSGAMKSASWVQWKGRWYYLTETGRMTADTWVGDYYVDASGAWVE